MSKVINFNAGPSRLPPEVLTQLGEELRDYRGSGISVLEMSHRSPQFETVAVAAETCLRNLLGLDDDWAVLFLQGGATSQFALLAMNLESLGRAGHVVSGHWSARAWSEARRLVDTHLLASSEASGFTRIPEPEQWQGLAGCGYVHITSNETIHGLQYPQAPVLELPLVADMSSDFLSRPLAIDRYAMIYAGAQKNAGPAGLTYVLIRKALLEKVPAGLPVMFDYRQQAASGSMLNTPPTFSWYVSGLVLQWIEKQGGLETMAARARQRSDLFYKYIDASDFYHNPVVAGQRSRMNIVFRLADDRYESRFLEATEAAGFIGLKGHRSVGGLRASLYNAVTVEETIELIDFMRDFEQRHG